MLRDMGKGLIGSVKINILLPFRLIFKFIVIAGRMILAVVI